MFSLEEQRNSDSSMDAFNSCSWFPTEGKFVQALGTGKRRRVYNSL